MTLSEIALALVFTLSIAFNFDFSAAHLSALETTITVCIYIAVCIPSVAGSFSLCLKLRKLLRKFVRSSYAIKHHQALLESVSSRSQLPASSRLPAQTTSHHLSIE